MRKVLKRKILQYTAVFEPDKEKGGYTVSIPSLPGCISEGETFEEALKNIQEAAILYLEVMRRKREELIKEEGIIVAPIQLQVRV
ncbi:MAG: type II toxin-antitoxin system HicB family antitoxin [Patescibacteria group bacterium]|nr:type II toxin-antitoxin system HicB family antitoxin [Patescibacteria group bacterium]